ncbi:MAG: ABC transporter ATP-binding protein/permease [Clostridiales bacterium]|nr:ABC transporter ATP-binding protein/permease [Clostridiales bacterium]
MKQNKQKQSRWKRLLQGYREIRRLVPQSLPVTILSSVAVAIHPFVNIYFSARIIDVLSTTKDLPGLARYIGAALALNAVLFLTCSVAERRTSYLRNLLYIRELDDVIQVFYHMDYEKLEDAAFQEKAKKYEEGLKQRGSFLWRMVWMVEQMTRGITTIICSLTLLWPLLRISLRSGGESFIESPLFTLVLLAGIAVAVGIILMISTILNKKWYELNDQYLLLNKKFRYYTDLITDYKTGKEIRIYRAQDLIEEEATREVATKGMEIQKKMSAPSARPSTFIALIGAVLGFGVYTFIGLKGLIGLFSVGALIQYTGSFMQTIQGVTSIANTTGQISLVLSTMDYYFDIIHTQPTKTYGDKVLEPAGGFVLEFRNVSFRYPGAPDYALRNVSITLDSRERLAIVGRNGSGKTTFIKLLCRLYDPQEGEILLNGVNIREYTEESYKKLFSVVFQDFALFSFPLGENIGGGTDYDPDQVRACLEAAGFTGRSEELPDGLSTPLYKDVEENGVEISGGEAQKLALSRALYKDAPFVILDEPTAALDPEAEFDIYSKFNKLVENKAAIYISHRLSSCKFCSKIAVFQNGRLVQLGSHDALIAHADSEYAALWHAQAQYYVDKLS